MHSNNTNHSASRSVCFVSLNAAGAFSARTDVHFGGVEKQTALMARWLAEHGHKVSVIVWGDEVKHSDEIIDGVRLIRICAQSDGRRIVRTIYPRWTSLCRALSIADSDVYFHNAAEGMTGQIALWCRFKRKRFIYSVASEPACEKGLPTINNRAEKCLYKVGLKLAAEVVVQTEVQSEKLTKNFNRRSIVLHMPCGTVGQSGLREGTRTKHKRVLWVGRIVPLKRLHLLLNVARLLPNLQFQIVGGVNAQSHYAENILREASQIDNVILAGQLSFEETWRKYSDADVLVCTSEYEGFPNTFLEAMAHGLPIISTFDPGNILAKERLGIAVSSVHEIVEALGMLFSNELVYMEFSRRAKAYFNRFHHVSEAMPKFEALIFDTSDSQKSFGTGAERG